jgi:pyruvate dehydrogenase E1 component
VLASTVPACQAFDPAFAYELAAIVDDGLQRMYGHADPADNEDVFYYLTVYNETYEMPPRPDHLSAAEIVAGLYRWADAADRPLRASVVFSGPAHSAAREAADELAQRWGVGVDLWSATSYKRLREDALAADRYNRLHPGNQPRTPLVTSLLADGDGPVVAVTDYMTMVPDQVGRWVGRPFRTLGTDGFGRSDTRPALRRFFEVDAGHVVVAVLAALAEVGDVDPSVVAEAIDLHGIDPGAPDPARHDTGPAPGHGVGRPTSSE